MPDPRQMSGMWMPSGDLPDGTVSVRVIRDALTNNLPGVAVELHGAGDVRRSVTGADGRAMFPGVPAGSTVHAVAVVNGERLESSPIEVPAKGGVRTLLVASGGTGAAPTPAAGASSGSSAGTSPAGSTSNARGLAALSLGTNSRVATEFSDDLLQVFYLLEIVNRSSEPVSPGALVFDMPSGAAGTTVLEGSTPKATARGARVTVAGPFPPGVTPLQIGFRIETFGSDLTLEARFPLPMEMVAIAAQKVGDMRIVSPRIARTQEVPLDAQTFVMGSGPRLEAGAPLILRLSGLPHHTRTGVYVALGLVAAIVACAAWIGWAPGRTSATAARRAVLEQRRDQGLSALAALEEQHRAGTLDGARYASRRASLIAQLERVYGELDAGGGPAGGRGVAA
jgi:hypothetical protein